MKNIAISFVIGGALGAVAFKLTQSDPATGGRAPQKTVDLEQERLLESQANRIKDLLIQVSDTAAKLDAITLERDKLTREQVTKLKIVPDDEPVDENAPITDEEFKAGLKKFASSLQAIILGKGAEARDELRALLKRAGPEGIKKIQEKFLDPAAGIQGRLIAAHALGQSGDPESIKLLMDTLRDPDKDMLERRVTSHALAFSDDPLAIPLLSDVARNDPDPGARANSAYGLINRDIDEGYDLYAKATDLAFENNQPEAMQYLQGFFLMNDKALPHVRERLLTYKNETALIVLIELIKQKKDRGALQALEKLAYDSGRPKSVQNAAQGAIKMLNAADSK